MAAVSRYPKNWATFIPTAGRRSQALDPAWIRPLNLSPGEKLTTTSASSFKAADADAACGHSFYGISIVERSVD